MRWALRWPLGAAWGVSGVQLRKGEPRWTQQSPRVEKTERIQGGHSGWSARSRVLERTELSGELRRPADASAESWFWDSGARTFTSQKSVNCKPGRIFSQRAAVKHVPAQHRQLPCPVPLCVHCWGGLHWISVYEILREHSGDVWQKKRQVERKSEKCFAPNSLRFSAPSLAF